MALLRQPRLVVKYLEGPQLTVDALEYAGVFLADPEVDGVFAASEPPTHDDWVSSFIESRFDRTVVNVSLREIAGVTSNFAQPLTDHPADQQGAKPLGILSLALAGLLPGAEATGGEAQGPREPVEGPSRGKKARVRILETLGPILEGDQPVLIVRFQVIAVPGTMSTKVRARTAVALDDGVLESDPPAGAMEPSVIAWRLPTGSTDSSETVDIPATLDPMTCELVVRAVPDAIVGVDIRPETTS